MGEKRRLSRRNLRHQLMVLDRETDELVGYLVDITTEGMMLTCKKPVNAEGTFNLKMLLPDKIKGSRQISFVAQNIWYRKDTSSGFYKTGFRLREISNGSKEAIQVLIQVFGASD